jgi:hypothetical protein
VKGYFSNHEDGIEFNVLDSYKHRFEELKG